MTEQRGVERTLGVLLAKVEGIERSIQRGDEHRAEVHRRVEDLANEVRDMKEDVADTKSVTDDVKRWKTMGMGALGVTGLASSAVTALLATHWDNIKRVFWGN